MADTKVTRIVASDAKPKKTVVKAKKATKQSKQPRPAPTNPILRGLSSFGGYFIGAWQELRLVRWPDRRSTWGLTLAVILFSVFFAVVILLLDILFKYLFELLLR
ncbi:MAG: preprotein translocase subunit SecE [Candidatus Saccharimonadales bacterium]